MGATGLMTSPGPAPMSWFERFRHVLTALLVLAIMGGGALFIFRRPPPVTITILPPEPTPTPLPTATPSPSPTPGPVQVYVTGAVRRPESLVWVPYGSRVSDAVAAAGGLAENADRERVNLAQILRDGDQVHVYALEEPAITLATPSDSGIVYVNTATVEELTQLPRIGPALAERIVAYREANGPFASLEGLGQVSGIGPTTLDQIAPFISFEIR